jgi:hypothetical protein
LESFWKKRRKGGGETCEEGRRTLGVELQNMQIAIKVSSYNVELLANRQDFCGDNFHVVSLLPEKSHFVRLFRIAGEPNAFECVSEDAKTGAREFFD